MTTSQVPPDSPAMSAPTGPTPTGPAPAGTAPSTVSASSPLDAALADLVRDGTLTRFQADAVVVAWSAHAEAPSAHAEPALTAAAPTAPPQPALPAWRGRLLEAAVYLGAAFVLAAAGIMVGQQWDTFDRTVQIALISGLTALGLVAGLVVAVPVRPVRGAPLAPEHAIRRRSASVILTATAALASGATAVVLGDSEVTGVAAAGVALLVMALTEVVAPSVLSEMALFGAGFLLMATIPAALLPLPTGGAFDEHDWETRDLISGGLLMGFGATWAWVLVRWLRHRTLGVALGLALYLIGAMTTTGLTTTPAVVAMAVLAVATLLTYLRDPEWPWIAATVIASTALVFLIAGDTLGPAFAFLVAGLVLLGGVALAVLLQRRRARGAARVAHPS